MPTVLLLDVSISMSQSIVCDNNSNDNSNTSDELVITFIDAMKSTINFLTETLANKVSSFMTDPICLIGYSSDIEVLIPFTNDYQEFFNNIVNLDIELKDKTNLPMALEKTKDVLKKSFGETSGLSVELFIFSDSCRSFDDFSQYSSISFPMIHQFHFISICLHPTTEDGHKHLVIENDHNQNHLLLSNNNNNNNDMKYIVHNVNNNFKGTVYIIRFQKNLNLKIEISNIIGRFAMDYEIFKCILTFGHLVSPITLYPNPITLFHYLDQPINTHRQPLTLSVIGFINNKYLYNLPTLSRHIVIPLVNDSVPPLGPVLQACCKKEKKSAFIMLRENWYAILTTSFENEVLVLTLNFLEPNIQIPDLCGNSGDLSTLEIGQDDPSIVYPIGLSPHILSYNTVLDPNPVPFLKSESLLNDFSKVLRLIKSLPAKFESLFNECEKIRSLSLAYQPNLLYQLSTTMREEIRIIGVSDERVVLVLENLIDILENGDITQPIQFPQNIQQFFNQQPQNNQQQQQQQSINSTSSKATTKKEKKNATITNLLNF